MHRRLLAVVAVAVLVGCQTINEEMPSSPTTVETAAPIPVVIVDLTPSPTPPPAAPQPPSGPGVAPPAPAPAPGARACTLPSGGGTGHCPRESPSFLSVVEKAMDELVAAEPQLFDLRKTRGCGSCYQVMNPTRYVNRVAEIVRSKGYCAVYDGEELAVKDQNRFNDQYDILTADNFIRRQTGSYRATCRPAWF
jgi:hypothetical protein